MAQQSRSRGSVSDPSLPQSSNSESPPSPSPNTFFADDGQRDENNRKIIYFGRDRFRQCSLRQLADNFTGTDKELIARREEFIIRGCGVRAVKPLASDPFYVYNLKKLGHCPTTTEYRMTIAAVWANWFGDVTTQDEKYRTCKSIATKAMKAPDSRIWGVVQNRISTAHLLREEYHELASVCNKMDPAMAVDFILDAISGVKPKQVTRSRPTLIDSETMDKISGSLNYYKRIHQIRDRNFMEILDVFVPMQRKKS